MSIRSAYCAIEAPFKPAYSGGEIRDAQLLNLLLQVGQVDFFAHYEKHDPQRTTPLDAAHSIHTPERHRRKWEVGLRKGLRWGRRRYYGEIDQLWHRAQTLQRIVNRYLQTTPPDFVFISPQINPLALMIQPLPATKSILVAWDVESERMQRLYPDTPDAQKAAQYEAKSLQKIDGIITMSAQDKASYHQRYGLALDHILALEPTVDLDYFAFRDVAETPTQNIIFVGSLNYPPNQQAAQRLIQAIMPLVWRRHPQAVCTIVGHSPPEALLALDDGLRVRIVGAVDDVRPYMQQAALTCIPLVSGSGVKYKLLEAFALGLPVVTTPIALQGLSVVEGQQVMVGNTDETLAQHIIDLLENPEWGQQLAHHAHQVIANMQRHHLSTLQDWLHAL